MKVGFSGLLNITLKAAKNITSHSFTLGLTNKILNSLIKWKEKRNKIQKYIAIERLYAKVFKEDQYSF